MKFVSFLLKKRDEKKIRTFNLKFWEELAEKNNEFFLSDSTDISHMHNVNKPWNLPRELMEVCYAMDNPSLEESSGYVFFFENWWSLGLYRSCSF